MGFLEDKTAVIVYTGSVDFGVPAAFVEEGCNLVLVGRSISGLETAKARLEVERGIGRAAARLASPEFKHLSGEILTLGVNVGPFLRAREGSS